MNSAAENAWRDLRYAARSVNKNRGFAATIVATLALGIGANSAVFSLVYAAILRPLPFPDTSRLAFISTARIQGGVANAGVSARELDDWRPQLHELFERFAAATTTRTATWDAAGSSMHLRNREVSSDFFPLLGVLPFAGRTFALEDTEPGHGGVVLISYDLWQKRFQSDPKALGQVMRQRGGDYAGYTIIGILPPAFEFDTSTDIWLPQQPLTPSLADIRILRRLQVVGRLRPAVTLAQARQAMDAVAAQQAAAYPASNRGWGISVVSIRDHFQSKRHLGLILLWAAVGCLLWIACANTANLLLSRAYGREREIAIRLALGSSRRRLTSQLLTESAFLALLGGVLGWTTAALGLRLLADWGASILPASNLDDLTRLHAGAINPVVALFTLLISVLAVLVFGLVPARRAARLELNDALQRSSGGHATESIGLSRILITGEVAVVMVLALSAGLLGRSLSKLTAVDPGFPMSNRIIFDIELPRPVAYATRRPATPASERFRRQTEWFEELERRCRLIPGVLAVGASDEFPLVNEGGGWGGATVGKVQLPPSTSMTFVTPGYFDAIGAPILQGSNFNDAAYSTPGSKALIINQTMARLLFPGSSAIGRHVNAPRCGMIAAGGVRSSDCVVVGIAQDTRLQLDAPAPPTFYYSLRQDGGDRTTFVIHAANDPSSLIPALRSTIANMPPFDSTRAFLFNLRTLDQLVAQTTAAPRFRSWLVSLFASLALLLAGVGIYGVQAHAITRRTREIGIRMALGARPSGVLVMILASTAAWTLPGIAAGLAAGLAVTRLISGWLFGVDPTDGLTLTLTPFTVIAAAMAAAYLPARRAMRVDPVVALRHE